MVYDRTVEFMSKLRDSGLDDSDELDLSEESYLSLKFFLSDLISDADIEPSELIGMLSAIIIETYADQNLCPACEMSLLSDQIHVDVGCRNEQ